MKFRLIIDKQIDEEEIVAVVRAPSALTERIEALVRSSTDTTRLIGIGEDGQRTLAAEEIECITVLERRIIAIDTAGEHFRLQERLRDLETVLPPQFLRINKSTLANEDHILRFDAGFGGGVDAVFRSGYREYVSRRCFRQIRRRYEGQ